MKTTIHMIVSVDQIRFTVHSMAKILPEINQLVNRSRPRIRWNIKQDDLERISQLIKFTHSKVCSNRLTTLMLSWGRNWVWIWAYQKPESKFGSKIAEQNLENKKRDLEMINQSWTDPVHKTISTELGWVVFWAPISSKIEQKSDTNIQAVVGQSRPGLHLQTRNITTPQPRSQSLE